MLKKLFVVFLVLAVMVLGWLQIRSSGKLSISFLQGKTIVIKRGNLTMPITASGTIEPQAKVDIKSEAGGIVAETPFEVGQLVKEGDLLVRLDPEDEQRMVDIASKALQQAEINLKRAENAAYQREHVDLPNALARLEQLEAELTHIKARYEKEIELNPSSGTMIGMIQLKSQLDSTLAQKKQLEVEVERARKNIEIAGLDLEQAKLTTAKTKDDLENAQERLRETRIIAPVAGMLYNLYNTQKGLVIASSSQSFGGGTLLATLADVEELYVKTFVDEADIGRVQELAPAKARPGHTSQDDSLASADDQVIPNLTGTPVKVTVEAFPDDQFSGVIDLIEPEPEKAPGSVVNSYVVRIRLISENSRKLFIGMQANVEFVAESVQDVLLVPNEAIRESGGQRGVYLQVDSAKTQGLKVPKFQLIKTGLDNGMYAQVIEGLSENAVVYENLPRDREGEEITSEEID